MANAKDRVITGILEITRSGYGFVIPDDPTLDDLFIPEHALGAALHGDRVRVEIQPRRRGDFRHFGRIVEILERASPRLVALVTEEGKARPEDPRNPYDFEIEKGKIPFQAGDKVLLDVTIWPGTAGKEPAGRVIERLGPAGAPETETAAILASYNAPGPFPPAVLEEVAQRIRERTVASDPAATDPRRLDLTPLLTFTIDPDTAKDYDDALSIEVLRDGVLRVGVHIADVSHFVPPNSRVDEEARDRATSIYLPDRVIPMLPEILSSDLCSLRPGEVRLTKTVFLDFTPEGECLESRIHRSMIRSRHRLTYRQVLPLLLAEGEESETVERLANETGIDGETIHALRLLHRLAQTLRRRRIAKGSIELDLPEFEILFNEAGEAYDMVKVEHDVSHQLVEEFMLAANRAVASWAAENGLPVLHRVHESPDEDAIEELALFLTALGYSFKLPLRRERLNAILTKAKGRPEEHAVNLAILKSFKQAVYHPRADLGHFALNFPRYLHFTSPIRRYPDLHLHQMLDHVWPSSSDRLPQKLRKIPIPTDPAMLERLGIHTSERERRAMKIEEEVKDFRRLELLSRERDREFTAVVTGIHSFGIFVEIEDYFVEGMIPRWMLEKKGYAAREEAPRPKALRRRTADGRRGFHLGEEIRVRITKIDLPGRLCEMELL